MHDDDWTGMDGQLWPGGTVGDRARRHATTYLCLPSRSDPRLLVPLRNRRAAARSVQRRLSGASWTATARRAAAAAVTRSGAAGGMRGHQLHVDGDGELATVLGASLGREIVVAVHLGAPRANRKPVLEVMDGSGGVLAWGKLGVNELTDQLVRDEGRNLSRLGAMSFRSLRLPELLASTRWRDHPLVLMSPLSPERGPVPAGLLVEASYELAQSWGTAGSDEAVPRYGETLARRVAALPDTPLTVRMAAVLPQVTTGVEGCGHGAWHGDWTPWNMGVQETRLAVWDWERLEAPVPIGMDLLHHRFQSDVMLGSRAPTSAALSLLDWCPPSPPGRTAPSAGAQQALAVLYLLGLATRYLADDQAATGNRLGTVSSWLEPVLATWQGESA